jgi:pyrroloquinoline-quinone synthase
MEIEDFFDQLEQLIARYDLLRHPFYQAWSRGELTREDLQEYAKDYYHHVESFPRCLAQFSRRLEKSELREVVLANLHDELGSNTQRAHADFWLDFAEGMGAGRSLLNHDPPSQIKDLTSFFRKVVKEGAPEEALAAFYAYESQVPRISREKLRGLTEKYQASDRTCSYFILHMTADVYHARMWREQLAKRIRLNAEKSQAALEAAKAAALNLWEGLSGIQSACLERLPQAL